MNRQSGNDPNEQVEKREDWLRPLRQRLIREMLYLQQLGLNEQGLERIQGWIDTISGMLLVAGPTGSGKTTTLYSLLHKLKLEERNVVAIEDTVEYENDGINHIQVDLPHGLDFAEGVKAMLRLDPDYLMPGEIREAASARAAITAATSGRALMGTLHSRDAVGVIDTLQNYSLSGQDISSTLIVVIAQRLVRKLCPHCKVEGKPDESEQAWLKNLGRQAPSSIWRAEGCERCNHTGYYGRTGISKSGASIPRNINSYWRGGSPDSLSTTERKAALFFDRQWAREGCRGHRQFE